MILGIDARAADDEPGGRGRYVRELLTRFARMDRDHRYVLYGRRAWADGLLDERFSWALSPRPDPAWHVGTAIRASARCDAFFSTNSYLTGWFTSVPTALVVFDMIAFHPEARPQRRAGLIERATLRPAVKRSAAILAISDSARDDLIELIPAAAPKAHTVHLGADPSFRPDGPAEEVARRHGIERPFALVAGTLEPRKNLPRLIEAFAGLPEDLRARHELVLVGATGWETDETFASIRSHADSVRTLGYVSDEDLRALYRAAELVCYPSLYEGFGLPVLEAMQSGTAVLTSNTSSMPEVGGDAARYVDPFDVEDIRRGLAELLSDPGERDRLARRGLERAREFSWDRTARETLDVLERMAA